MAEKLIRCPWCSKEFDLMDGVWHGTPIHDTSKGDDDRYVHVEYRLRKTEHRCEA